MIRRVEGYVEAVFANHVTGWAADVAGSLPITVAIRTREGVLARTSPVFARPDVEAVKALSVASGFYLACESVGMLLRRGDAWLEAGTDATGYTALPLVEHALDAKIGQYQSFAETDAGASQSHLKLEALRLDRILPSSTRRPRLLDIGCNEGFFCNALAQHFNAEIAIGVDTEPGFIERARIRFPHVDFRVQSWWDVEEGDFDIIVFLSAVHYEADQQGLFQFLRRKLSKSGVLILECGIAEALMIDSSEKWVVAHRHDGLLRYPTYDHLTTVLLANYSTRWVGESVSQDGDPVRRHVLHCRPKRQDLILLGGTSGRGKTELSQELGSARAQVVRTDLIIMRLLTDPYLVSAPLAQTLRSFFQWPADITRVQRMLADHNLIGDFVALVFMTIDKTVPAVMIEGAFLDYPDVVEAICSQAGDFFKIWRL